MALIEVSGRLELVRCVGDKLPFARKSFGEPREQVVKAVSQPSDLVAPAAQSQLARPAVESSGGERQTIRADLAHLARKLVDRRRGLRREHDREDHDGCRGRAEHDPDRFPSAREGPLQRIERLGHVNDR